ncbi:MAG: protein-disulfide reductase DsbD domain-containing protein, partial [Gemmatimonadaceae bacterium]
MTTVAFRITMDRGWHTYWTNPGDAGLPLAAQWSLPTGVTVSSLRFPVPHLVPQAPLMSFGYENEVLVLADVTVASSVPAGKKLRIEADVDFLVCAEQCLPASAHVGLAEMVVASPVPSRWSDAIDSTQTRLAQPTAGWDISAWRDGKRVVMLAHASANTHSVLQQVFLVPDSTGVLEHALPQTLAVTGDTIVLAVTPVATLPDTTSRLQGVLLNDAVSPTVGFQIDVALAQHAPPIGARLAQLLSAANAVQTGGVAGAVATTPGINTNTQPNTLGTTESSSAKLGVWLALLLAFGGGLLLNLMPCVFPVLSIKILAFVERGGDPGGGGGSAVAIGRKHALVFTMGVLVTFWVLAGALLALRAGGAQLGWGFQLQSPGVVAALALVVFALALNLSGVFTVGASLTRLGAVGSGERYSDSFLTGLLAVVVATPCTAPFMGAALGFALTQSALVGMAVFTSLGLGLAAPYIVFASSPALLRKLPRPGPWLETLKQLLAFPLYATV